MHTSVHRHIDVEKSEKLQNHQMTSRKNEVKKVREINFLITTNFPHTHFTYIVTTEIIPFQHFFIALNEVENFS